MTCKINAISKIGQVYKGEAKTIKFSGGELHPSIKFDSSLQLAYNRAELFCRIQSSDDLMELLLMTDIIRRNTSDSVPIAVTIPYLPYGRQDRQTSTDVSFSLSVFASIINAQSYDYVRTFDCHSYVSNALIRNLKEVTALDILKKNNIGQDTFDAFVAPDAGALKKTIEIASFFEKDVIVGLKKRNVINGKLSSAVVLSETCPPNVLIVDDICDGGGTFIALAQALQDKGAKKVCLYVTHGIFSKGLEVFNGLIDEIYTTNTFIPNIPKRTNNNPTLVTLGVENVFTCC